MNRAEFVALLQRNNGWKLWSSVVLITILVVEAIVATLDILFYGHIIMDDMIKGFVATAIVEPTHLVFMVFMLGEFAKAERRAIQLSAATCQQSFEHRHRAYGDDRVGDGFPTEELRYEDELLRSVRYA